VYVIVKLVILIMIIFENHLYYKMNCYIKIQSFLKVVTSKHKKGNNSKAVNINDL